MILQTLRNDLLKGTTQANPDSFKIRGVWNLHLQFQPSKAERLFAYDVVLVQTTREGCCYVYGRAPDAIEIIGADARSITTANHSLDIAILDAAYSAIPTTPLARHAICGTSLEKSRLRAAIVCREVAYWHARCAKRHSRRIAVIGAIGLIIAELQQLGYDVVATDLDPTLIGSQLGGVRIEDGESSTLRYIADAAVALVTGMTLSSGTLAEIMKVAEETKTPLVMVCETGAWLASRYCELFGVSTVVAEPFPFYIFSGTSELFIYRRHETP